MEPTEYIEKMHKGKSGKVDFIMVNQQVAICAEPSFAGNQNKTYSLCAASSADNVQ